jgi:hypothetical protein
LLYSTTYIRRSIYAVVLESMQLAHALLAWFWFHVLSFELQLAQLHPCVVTVVIAWRRTYWKNNYAIHQLTRLRRKGGNSDAFQNMNSSYCSFFRDYPSVTVATDVHGFPPGKNKVHGATVDMLPSPAVAYLQARQHTYKIITGRMQIRLTMRLVLLPCMGLI